MVVQRTLDKIEELKERPHHERRQMALWWAVGVTVFLVLFWGFFAVRGIGRTAMQLSVDQQNAVNTAQTASVAATGDQAVPEVPRGLTASSTNGYVDLVQPSQTGL